MARKILLMALLVAFLIVPSVSAYIEYTPTTKTECNYGKCYTTFYSGTMFAQDSQGDWTYASNVIYITKYQDDLTFHYDGIDGEYSITFEAGVIYNGNYYSMSEVKQMKPNINFNFPTEQGTSHYKYSVNITNLDELNIELIENITLTYKSHEGFNLNQIKMGNRTFKIKSTLQMAFTDLFDLYTIKINKNEKRLYISNITDNIIDGSLYLDPSLFLQDPGTENLDDTKIGSSNPDNNFGNQITFSLIVDVWVGGDDLVQPIIKFNITDLPDGATITDANLSMKVETGAGADYSLDINIYEYDNQTWSEEVVTWNKFETDDIGDLISVTAGADWTSANRMPFNVTSWVKDEYESSNTNVSFWINGSAYELNTRMDWITKEIGAAAQRPWLNITYEFVNFGINMSVFSAVNGITPITLWSVNMSNSTDMFISFDNNNPLIRDITVLPAGPQVNLTIHKAGYVNASYNVSIDGTHRENFTGFIFTEARGLITLHSPANGSSFGGLQLFINVTAPGNISGFLDGLYYELNGSGNFIELCVDCLNFSGFITLGGLGEQDIVIKGNSSIYGELFQEAGFTNLFATYNIILMDELRNITFDMSLVDFANLTAFCPDSEPDFDITKNFTETVEIGCEFDYLKLELKLFNQSASHFRTLIPDFDAENVTFYMIDNITKNPDENFIDVKLIFQDLTGNFLNGIVHIRKALNGSIIDIIDKNLDAQGAINAYLVINERYRLFIESVDGTEIRNLGDLIIRSLTDTEIILTISDLDIFPPIEDNILWRFTANQSELFINFTYNDTLSQTNSVTFNVYNVTDPSDRVLVFSDTQAGSIVNFSFSTAAFDNTYLAEFIADHQVFGDISETRIFIFTERLFPIGLLELEPIWYSIISIFLIMMTALLFGARAAPWGAAVVAIEAAFFVMIGWLEITIPIISLVILIAVLSAIGYRRREQ